MKQTRSVSPNRLFQPQSWLTNLILAVVVGVAMGFLAYVASQQALKWMVVIVGAVAVPILLLLVKDLRSLILVVLVADISLGVDIALQDQDWHQGGPTGYIISLMTFVLIMGYGLWLLERKPKFNWAGPVTIPVLLYLGTIVASLAQAQNIQLSLFSVFLNVQFLLYYLYLANFANRWDNLRLVMTAATVLLLGQSIYMLLQYFLGVSITLGFLPSSFISGSRGVSGVRIGGTIGTPNSAAAYLATMIGVVLSGYASGKLISSRLALPAFGLGFAALILTMTRSAWGSLAIIVVIMTPWLWRSTVGRKLLPQMAFISVFVLALFGVEIYNRLQTTLTDTTREELAYMAYNIIDAYPLGIGENNYDQVMSDQYAHPVWVGHTHYPVHNKYLLIWAEDGIWGLAAFVLLLIAAAWQAARLVFLPGLDKNLAVLPAGLLAVLTGYSFHMTNEGFASRVNLQLLWFVLALIMAIKPLLEESVSGPKTTPETNKG